MDCVTFIQGMTFRRATDDEIRYLENFKRNLRKEDVSIHYLHEHRSKFTDYVLSPNGIKMPNVAGDVQTDEAEHGKLTSTASVLAAAGTKVQEVAADVQTDEAEHGKSTLTDSVLAAAGTKVQEVADEA